MAKLKVFMNKSGTTITNLDTGKSVCNPERPLIICRSENMITFNAPCSMSTEEFDKLSDFEKNNFSLTFEHTTE